MTLTSVPMVKDSTTQSADADIRVAVSTVIFALRPSERDPERRELAIPLVRRIREPYGDRWALPGGWLRAGESLAEAAARTLAETTGLAPSYLEQLYAFGAVDRSPSRVVSIVYWALVRADEAERSTPADNTAWHSLDAITERAGLAFDHDEIVAYARWRLENKVGYSRIAQGFLPQRFTLAELRDAHETITGRRIDPANFRRQVEATGAIIPTKEFRTGAHRPARLYLTDPDLELAERGPLRER